MEKALRDTLRALLGPTVERLGYRISGLDQGTDTRGGMVLRVFVDADSGVGIHDCAVVSREISPILDVADPIVTAYRLEVSSPGFDRIIDLEEDFNRFAGFRIKVKLHAYIEGQRRYTGTLIGAGEGAVEVEGDGVRHQLPMADIAIARLSPTPDQYDRLRDVSLGRTGDPDQ
jgi:ribosome maturation factor RimP